MIDLMEDFSIVFTIISITVILYFVFFGVWGHLEEKKHLTDAWNSVISQK